MKFKFITTVFMLILFVIQPFNSSSKYDYYPTEGWLSATPEEHGMSSAVLVGMYEYIEKNNLDIDCVIVIKNGYIVEERYLDPKYDQDTLHRIYSCTKSISSALIGITIHDGYISSINHRILDFFSTREIANLDSQKQAITLEHLLTMTSGLDWKEWPTFVPDGDSANTANKWHESEDWVKFVLDRPMANESGEVFNYNSGTSHLLSAIIQYVTGNSTLTFAQKHLFDPLGIKSISFDWPTDPQGINLGSTGMTLTPRDMAKFGFLYLNYGIWDGKQIIPREWVEISTRSHISASSHIRGKDYGYQWWIYPTLNAYTALGWAGQRIFVIPNHNLVVVFTGRDLNFSADWYFNILTKFIIPADKSGISEINRTTSFPIVLLVLEMIIIVIWRRRMNINK